MLLSHAVVASPVDRTFSVLVRLAVPVLRAATTAAWIASSAWTGGAATLQVARMFEACAMQDVGDAGTSVSLADANAGSALARLALSLAPRLSPGLRVRLRLLREGAADCDVGGLKRPPAADGPKRRLRRR